jgi:hypothetical protein
MYEPEIPSRSLSPSFGRVGRGTGFCIVFGNPKRERGLYSSLTLRVTIAFAKTYDIPCKILGSGPLGGARDRRGGPPPEEPSPGFAPDSPASGRVIDTSVHCQSNLKSVRPTRREGVQNKHTSAARKIDRPKLNDTKAGELARCVCKTKWR